MKLIGVLCLIALVTCSDFDKEKIDRYRDKAKNMFYHAYNGYLRYAFPYDELKPISCSGMDTWGSFSLTLIDALDTLILMGNFTEFERAAQLVLKSIDFNANVNVSVFETNIRVIGGLLAAHVLSGIAGVQLGPGWPCSGPLLTLAERLADKLMPAFNTFTGMPYGTVNLRYGVHSLETPITCTAGVGTFLLEFGTLSRLTGSPHFERVAMKALKELWLHRSPIGLRGLRYLLKVGNHINVQTGQWTATDAGIGAGVDSYFEYLLKGGILFNKPALVRQFNEYKKAIETHVMHDDWFFWVSMNKGQVTLPIFQSLEQFWPGLLSLIGEFDTAKRIMLNYHQVLRQYGFPPEFYNVPTLEAVQKRWGYPLRPEFIESLVYLYQATKDPLYLHMGADALEAIEYSTKTKCGYATVHNVKDHILEDRMESFFLAETIKYLYLLFDADNFLHSVGKGRIIDTPNGKCVIETGGYIFNTEAHPLDPSILYCCSAHRKRDIEIVEKFQSNIDLFSLLGVTEEDQIADIEADEDEIFSSIFSTRSELLKELTIPTVAESLSMTNGKQPKTPPAASEKQQNETQETVDGIGYEIDPNYKQIHETVEELAPGKPQTRKVLSFDDEKQNSDDLPPTNDTTDTSGGFQATVGVQSPQKDVIDEFACSNTAKPLHENTENYRTEETSTSTVSSSTSFTVTTSSVVTTSTNEQLINALQVAVQSLESILSLSTQIQNLAESKQTECSLNDNDNFSSSPNMCPLPEDTVCRIHDLQPDSRLLTHFLKLIYGRSKSQRLALRYPMCFKGETLKEEDYYNRVVPDTNKLKGLEKDSYIDGPTLSEIKLRNFNVKELGEYQYHVMSCRSPDFAQRLSVMGQIINR